jgi:hypothetical protein
MTGNQPYPGLQGADFRGAQGFSFGTSTNNSTNTITNSYNGDPAQTDDVARLLGELDQRITEHRNRLSDVDDIRAAIEAIKEQMSSGRPSRGVLKTLLLGMTSAASGVEAVAGAIERVRAALGV